MEVKDLGTHLRTLREHRMMTQRQLAAKARVSQSVLCNIERGNTKNPGLLVVEKLCKALGARIEIK